MTSPAARLSLCANRPGTPKIGAIQCCDIRDHDPPSAFGHRPILLERRNGAEAREQRIAAPAIGKSAPQGQPPRLHLFPFSRCRLEGVQEGLGLRRPQTRIVGAPQGSHSPDRAERPHKAAGDSHRRLPWPQSQPLPKNKNHGEQHSHQGEPASAAERWVRRGHERPRAGIVAPGGPVRYDLLQSSKTWPSKTSPWATALRKRGGRSRLISRFTGRCSP
jgi:hypothetical protein